MKPAKSACSADANPLRSSPDPAETPLAFAERLVRELEEKRHRQNKVLLELEGHHVPSAATAAREVLSTLEYALQSAHRNLECLKSRPDSSCGADAAGPDAAQGR
jgi:hypothetical protein